MNDKHEAAADDGRPRGATERFGSNTAGLSRRRVLSLTTLGLSGVIGASTTATAARELPRTLSISGVDTYTEYTVSVSGDIAGNGGLTREDRITDTTASGAVRAGRDSYRFSGDVTGFSMSSDGIVSLDGTTVDVTEFLPRTLRIDGTGSFASYSFAVDGDIAGRGGHSSEDTIDIERGRVEGAVGGGRDSYAFSGSITAFDLAGGARVLLDGTEVDPVRVLHPHRLVIDGAGKRTDYSISVSGDLVADSGLTGEDDISGSSATGAVGGGHDSYAFSGSLVDLDVDGPATVSLDGEALDTGRLAHTLMLESNGGRFAYEFTVGDVLRKSVAGGATVDDNDAIDGTTATGQGGGGGMDSYAFSGDLLDLDVTGDATVTLDGEPVDANPSPLLGIHNGLSDANFDTMARIEEWQGSAYPVQNFFVPWDPSTGHMNWLFDEILPRIDAAGRVPLITWEPFTPGTVRGSKTAARRSVAEPRTAADAREIVERGNYNGYLRNLASATPKDIEVRVAAGEYDPYIDEWADRLREFLAGSDGVLGTDDDRRAYLRLGHEMNGDWYPWAPTVGESPASSYVDMWRHVHDRFAAAGIENVEWMWCVNATDVGSSTAEDLYPGDSYVDWTAIDGYQWGASKGWSNWDAPETVFGEMLGRVRTITDKPVCIAETASSSKTAAGYDPERKGEWIRAAFSYFEDEGIDMWCWFNEDKETDWAMFDGARGTESVVDDGERVDAYAAYREGVGSYDTAITSSGSMTTAAFTGER